MILSKNIAINISACLSGLPFSFDELILETGELFQKHGVPGFLKVLISFTDNMVVEQWKASDDEYNKESCCESRHLNRNGSRSKQLYTSLGNIDFEWSILRCKNCGKVFHPLKDFLDIGKFQKVTNEFEKICMETVAKESFRFGTQTLNKLKHVGFNHRTLHGWFKRTNSDHISVIYDDIETLFADGTGYKKFVSLNKQEKKNNLREKLSLKPIEETKRGEVKVMLGIKSIGKIRITMNKK